jgi:hypothetical protein
MPLMGEAKRSYMRQYMRNLRAGLPTVMPRPPKPAPPDKPIRMRYCSFCWEMFDRRVLYRRAEGAICQKCVCEAVVALQPAALVAALRGA